MFCFRITWPIVSHHPDLIQLDENSTRAHEERVIFNFWKHSLGTATKFCFRGERGRGTDCRVSSYSSYLALQVCPLLPPPPSSQKCFAYFHQFINMVSLLCLHIIEKLLILTKVSSASKLSILTLSTFFDFLAESSCYKAKEKQRKREMSCNQSGVTLVRIKNNNNNKLITNN